MELDLVHPLAVPGCRGAADGPPAGLTVETFDGSAWIGLTPFLMEGVRAPGVPAVPWLSRFPEINVRTYVRDGRGRSGIWFLSSDAARLPAVLAARASYRLPYFWSDMAVRVSDGRPAGVGRAMIRLPGRRAAKQAAGSVTTTTFTSPTRSNEECFL